MKRWPADLLVLIVRGHQLFVRPMLDVRSLAK